MPPIVRSLGPASLAFPLAGAGVLAGRLYLVSRNLSPAAVAVYDLARGAVSDTFALPDGAGAWGVTAGSDAGVYIGVFGARRKPNLYRYDPATGQLRAVALLDVDYIWALAGAPDGQVYGVTAPDMVFRYDPVSNRADDLGIIDASRDRVRSVAVDARTLYVGGSRGGRALLLAVNRATRNAVPVLPAPLARDHTVYALATSAYHLLVGTRGAGAVRPAVGALDRNNLGAARVAFIEDESVVDAVTAGHGSVWCTARPSGALYRLDLANGALTRVSVPVDGAETRGLFNIEGRIVGAAATGHVWVYSPPAEGHTSEPSAPAGAATLKVVNLLDAGLRGRPELPQSLAAGHGNVYVGANFSFTVLDALTRARRRYQVPGEPKDLAVLGDHVYLALYPTAQVWAYTPDGGPPRRVAQLPVEQNRPVSVAADARRGLVFITTASDRLGGGALHMFEPPSGRVVTLLDPLGSAQHPSALAVSDGVVYVGGSGTGPSLAAFRVDARQRLWQLDDPVPQGSTFSGLALHDDRLFGLTMDGWLVAVDLGTRALVHRMRVRRTGGRLRVAHDAVFAATSTTLVRIEPRTLAFGPVVSDLAAKVWGWPPLGVDEDGRLYVIRRLSVLQVTPEP